MSKADLPPVPPANQGRSGGAEVLDDQKSTAVKSHAKAGQTNFDEQGQTGNMKINTTHHGHQQDR